MQLCFEIGISSGQVIAMFDKALPDRDASSLLGSHPESADFNERILPRYLAPSNFAADSIDNNGYLQDTGAFFEETEETHTGSRGIEAGGVDSGERSDDEFDTQLGRLDMHRDRDTTQCVSDDSERRNRLLQHFHEMALRPTAPYPP